VTCGVCVCVYIYFLVNENYDPTTERQDESIKRESLTIEVEHKVKQQLSQVLNDAQVCGLWVIYIV